MPYRNISEIPAHVKKYPPKKQRQWRAIFNSVYRQTNNESRAFAAANASLKRKKKSLSKLEINKIIKEYVLGIRTGKFDKEELEEL